MGLGTPFLLYTILGFSWMQTTTGLPAIQYRISETQFSELAKTSFRLSYTGEGIAVGYGKGTKPDDVRVTIPRDGVLKTVAHFDSMSLSGAPPFLSASGPENDINYKECLLTSEGEIASKHTVNPNTKGSFVSFSVSDCHLKCQDFESQTADSLNKEHVLEQFQTNFCQNYKVSYDIQFEDEFFKLNMSGNPNIGNVSGTIHTSNVQLLDSALVLDIQLRFVRSDQPWLPPPPLIPFRPRPIPREYQQQSPFEIWCHVSEFDGIMDEWRRFMFMGNKPNLSSFVSLFDAKEMQKIDMLFPGLDTTFPNSTFGIKIIDVVPSGTFPGDAFWMHMNITGEITATLNCDPSRSYTAFSFQALMSGPIQLAFDHRFLGLKYTTFRGNFTILDTNIGRIADRFIQSMFYALPELAVDGGYMTSKPRLHGTRLSKMTPVGYYLENVKIRLLKDYLVVGGDLTTENVDRNSNRIPYQNLTWVGRTNYSDYFAFPFIDNTPEGATPKLPEQNCRQVASASVSVLASANMAAVFVVNMLLMCFLSCALRVLSIM